MFKVIQRILKDKIATEPVCLTGSARFRGRLDGKCPEQLTAVCAGACPVQAFQPDAASADGYRIDYRRCLFCGRCVEAASKAAADEAGLLHHSDRGSQYCARTFRDLLNRYGMRASMSGKGNCYDNAPMESFWGTLKTEHVFHRQYETRQQAMREITEYIEIFYNRQRRQKQLGYLAPAVFERQFYELLLAA